MRWNELSFDFFALIGRLKKANVSAIGLAYLLILSFYK